MEFVLVLHQGLSRMSWMFFLALGLWGGYRAIRGQGIDGNYLGAAVVGQALFILQAIIGVVLWIDGRLPNLARPEVHILYGAFVVVFLPFIYLAVLRGDDSNRGMWIMTFSTLFLFGVALRLIDLGYEVLVP
ncbi:MAG: hypothetical protein KC419_14980 [Anaerolineales bacterium]|nr:hypothetical protein [Anaerolineales bacterium]